MISERKLGLRIRKKWKASGAGGEYIHPHHKDHPYPYRKNLYRVLQGLRILPSPKDHVIHYDLSTKLNKYDLIIQLERSHFYNKVTRLASEKLRKISKRHFKIQKKGVIRHEKTHYKQQRKFNAAATYTDGYLIYKTILEQDLEGALKIISSLKILRSLMEAQAIYHEILGVHSSKHHIVRISNLLKDLAAGRDESGLRKLVKRVTFSKDIQQNDYYSMGLILTLLGSDNEMFFQLLSGKYNAQNFSTLETRLIDAIEISLKNPKYYIYKLRKAKNTPHELDQTIKQVIQLLNHNIDNAISHNYIPNSIKNQLTRNK